MARLYEGMQTSSYLMAIGILLLIFGFFLGLIALAGSGLVVDEACLGFVVGGCTALLLSFYAKQIGEENLGFWSTRKPFSRKLRRSIGMFLLVWAFVFYYPIVPIYVGNVSYPYTASIGSILFYDLNSNYPSLFGGSTGAMLNFLGGFSMAYFT
jgi:hypothetical protein